MSTMARKKTKTDAEDYVQLPSKTWKEALTGTRADVGILSQLPCRAMLSKRKHKVRKDNHDERTSYDVIYDEEYVFDYYYKKLITALGFVVGDDFDTVGYDGFCKRLKEYSLKEQAKQLEENLLSKAEELAALSPNKSAEEWLIVLKENVSETQNK